MRPLKPPRPASQLRHPSSVNAGRVLLALAGVLLVVMLTGCQIECDPQSTNARQCEEFKQQAQLAQEQATRVMDQVVRDAASQVLQAAEDEARRTANELSSEAKRRAEDALQDVRSYLPFLGRPSETASQTPCYGYIFQKVSGATVQLDGTLLRHSFGHVAWGFAGNNGGVAWGSVDGWQQSSWDKKYFEIESDSEAAMISDMGRRGFDAYAVKSLAASSCNYPAALSKSMSSTSGWYLPVAANCADATMAVLKSFGFRDSDFGNVSLILFPNDWFGDLVTSRGWIRRTF